MVSGYSFRFVLIFFILFFVQSVISGQQKLLFHYNSDPDYASDLQSDVRLNDVIVEKNIDDEENPARGAGGWGYHAINTSHFYSDSSSVRSTENVVMSFVGNHEISGELWVKFYSANGLLLTWGDSEKPDFLSLRLQNKKLVFHRRIFEKSYNLKSDFELQTSQWYYIHWMSRVKNDSVMESIYLNGKLIGCQKEILGQTLNFLVFNDPVTLGFSSDENLPIKSFHGELYAATVKNFIPIDAYKMSAVPFDGSAYLGMLPVYYSDNDVIQVKRVAESKTEVLKTAFVPYMNDDFIPQGLTNSFEDNPSPGADPMVYLSMYNKDINGSLYGKRSVIVELNPSDNYKVRRCFRLSGDWEFMYGHNSAIACKNNSLYIGGANRVWKCDLPEFQGIGTEKYQELKSYKSWEISSSSVTICRDSIWVGDWSKSADEKTPYLYGYPLDAEGDIITRVPPKLYRIPFYVQGLTWTCFQGQDYLFVSTSWGGTNDSKLYRFRREKLSKFSLAEADTIFYLPSGGEDLSFNGDGNLLNVSESGVKRYQLREKNPWKQYYPFLFEISKEVLFADIATSVFDPKHDSDKELPLNFNISAYPNPFHEKITIIYSIENSATIELKIFNLAGQLVKVFTPNGGRRGSYKKVWNAREISTGIYFIQLSANGNVTKTKKILMLK